MIWYHFTDDPDFRLDPVRLATGTKTRQASNSTFGCKKNQGDVGLEPMNTILATNFE